MRIVSLTAENFKILKAVEIAPGSDIVTIAGKNGMGKSSVLDAIWVALVGRSVAPPRPIRAGEEKCTIALDMGDLVVTRTFTAKEGGKYTDSVKVEDPEGRRYGRPQEVLDELLGEIGFDPFQFVQLKPAQQAEMLLQLVPLPIDLEEMGEADESDYAARRDVNREAERLEAQAGGIPKETVPDNAPDRRALLDQLSSAADTNQGIAVEQQRRETLSSHAEQQRFDADLLDQKAQDLRAQAAQVDKEAADLRNAISDAMDEIANLDPLPQPVDTAALREKIAHAEEIETKITRQQERAQLVDRMQELRLRAEELTNAMKQREQEREKALANAQMPIDGLGFQVENGKPIVTFGGQPFEQVSRSQQIRVSAAIAMAANPQLRVLRISDGSLLDEDALAMLAGMAKAEDFQLWIEKVGTGEVGFILENGELKKELVREKTT